MKRFLIAGTVAAMMPALAVADALDCAGGIVEAGDSVVDLVDKCGEPQSKAIEGYNWYYQLGAENYKVRVSESGNVAEIKQIFD